MYINELLHHYTPCHSLRSSDSNLLVIPKTNIVDRSYAAIAPMYGITYRLPLDKVILLIVLSALKTCFKKGFVLVVKSM